MPEEVKDIVGRLYENFLMRDLTYVFGGALLLASIKYAYDGNLLDAIDYVSQDFLKFILFLTISYFIGLIVQEGASFIKIVKTRPKIPKPYNDYFILMEDIQEKYGFGTIRRIERIVYLKHVGAAVGSASLIGSFILLVSLIKYHKIGDFIAFFILIAFTIVCLIENRWKLKQQNETLKHLANNMNDTKEHGR